jgi:hypothetical protein
MSQYLVKVITSSPAAADLILRAEEYDTGCTGGVRSQEDGSFAIYAVLDAPQMQTLRQQLGVLRVDVVSDVEANRQARLQELMGRPAF